MTKKLKGRPCLQSINPHTIMSYISALCDDIKAYIETTLDLSPILLARAALRASESFRQNVMDDLHKLVSDEEMIRDTIWDTIALAEKNQKDALTWTAIKAIETVLLQRHPWMDEFYQSAMMVVTLQEQDIFIDAYDAVWDEVNDRDRDAHDEFILSMEKEFLLQLRGTEKTGEECPICLNPPRAPVRVRCYHLFCLQCIARWDRSNPTCPLCRVRL